MSGAAFGVFGLGVMGQNLARNVASRGGPVAVYNRTPARTERMIADHGPEGDLRPADGPAAFVRSLGRPRRLVVMVTAGPAVDEAIAELRPHLDEGDVLID